MTGRPQRVPWRRLARDLGPERRQLAVGVAAVVVGQALAVATPVLIGLAIDRGVIGRDRSVLVAAVAAACGVVAASVAVAWLQVRTLGRFGQAFLAGMRWRLLLQLHALDLERITGEITGRLVSRLTSDVDNMQQFVDTGVPLGIAAMVSVVLTLAAMFSQSPPLTGLVVVVLLPILAAARFFRRRAHAAQLEVREQTAQLLGRLGEAISGMRLVQAYGAEAQQRDAFERVNAAALRARLRTARLVMAYYPPVEFLQPVALAAVLTAGLAMVGAGAVQVGVVISFVLLVGRLFDPILQFSDLTTLTQSASASVSRITAFLDERPALRDAPDAAPLRHGPGAVAVEGVSFRYGADLPPVLRDVDLAVPAGQRVAVIGESGAGKSTLARMLVRFHDPTAGRVLVDGVDLRAVTLSSLRRAVVLVPQEGFLFDGTVADNIAMVQPGRSAADVEAACRRAGVLDALSTLPHGLQTRVSGGGQNLSAGQRQLVALARALYAEPRVVVLDEATSNLDPATEALVEAAMRAVLRDRTAVVIAHRVATALRADRVVLMEDGRIVEDGAPVALLGRDTRFAAWVRRSRAGAGGSADGEAARATA